MRTADAWTPADYGQLVNLAVQSKSVAFKAATVFQTDKVKVNFPYGSAIPPWPGTTNSTRSRATDGATGEVVVTPSKTAGITRISSELGEDTDSAIADQIGAALANQIAEAVDTAWLANTTTKANNGLLEHRLLLRRYRRYRRLWRTSIRSSTRSSQRRLSVRS